MSETKLRRQDVTDYRSLHWLQQSERVRLKCGVTLTYLTSCKAWPTEDEHSVFENQGTRSVSYCLQIESKLTGTEPERVDFQRQMLANIGIQSQNGLCPTWSRCWTIRFCCRCNRARVIVAWTTYRTVFLARALFQIIVKLSAAYKNTLITP